VNLTHFKSAIRLFSLAVVVAAGLLVVFTSDAWAQQSKQSAAEAKIDENLSRPMITVKVREKGKTYYGRPLAWDGKKLALLRWDGRISQIELSNTKLKIFSKGFAPYSREELEKRLRKQYGDRYAISKTEHFLVVHPSGPRRNWALPYENNYRRFYNYFSKRKFKLEEPQFPMVVVVLGSRNEFDREIEQEITYKKNVFGFYSRLSNRVTTFVSNDPRESKRLAKVIKTTAIHETVHQAAFNTGLHNRLCTVPRWLTEGLAMMFESNGVNNQRKFPSITDRINRERLLTLRKMYRAGIGEGKLESMVKSDRSFQTDPQYAYALSWGLTFYLAEKKQDKYFDYLKADSARKELTAYSPADRLADFSNAFGTDFEALENDLKKFILSLPTPLN
jgi:hypothetical protein